MLFDLQPNILLKEEVVEEVSNEKDKKKNEKEEKEVKPVENPLTEIRILTNIHSVQLDVQPSKKEFLMSI